MKQDANEHRHQHRRTKLKAVIVAMVGMPLLLAFPANVYAEDPATEPVPILEDLDAAVAETGGQPAQPLAESTTGDTATFDGEVEVTVPLEGDAVIEIEGTAGIGLELPVAESSDTEIVGGDTVVFDGAQDGYDVAVQPLQDGVRALVSISDAGAPDRYDFDLDLPEGTQLLPQDDGSVLIAASADGVDTVHATIAAPWAIDANGDPVETRYTVHGTTLTQHVQHEGAAYPVVADPSIGFGWAIYVTFNRSESRTIGLSSITSKAKFIAVVCATIPSPVLATGCGLVVFEVWQSIANTFKTAASRSCETELKFTYNYVLYGWKTKNCLR